MNGNIEAAKERGAATALLRRLNRVWITILAMLGMSIASLVVALTVLRVAGDLRGFAREARSNTEALRDTAQIIDGCTNPEGECFKRFTDISTQQAEERLNEITRALHEAQELILSERRSDAGLLLLNVTQAIDRLNSLAQTNAQLQEQIAALLTEVALLRQIIARPPPPVGVPNPPAPAPSNVTCSLLPPSLGVLIGCSYG